MNKKEELGNKIGVIVTLCSMLIVELEGLEEHRVYRHNLKRLTKRIIPELEKVVDTVYASNNNKGVNDTNGHFVSVISDKIYEFIKSTENES